MALSDPQGVLASPLAVIDRRDDRADIEIIVDIIRQKQVGRVVAGLPRSMNGSVGKQAEKVKAFTEKLCAHVEIAVEFRDERLSTVSAKRLMREANSGKLSKRTRDDAVAAAIVLQSYLDERS